MRNHLLKASLFLVVSVAVAGLAACGGGDDEETPAGNTPAATGKTPAAGGAQGGQGTLPARSGDFAPLCQKSNETQFSEPQVVIDPAKSYTAVIKTEKGDITLELFADAAPVTVNSFVFLACKGYYDNITWHRVLPAFVAQTGDPTGSGSGGPGYEIPDEIGSLKFEKGSVGMANRGPNTNGSQFFICLEAQPKLDGKYTVFAKVTAGFDVVEKLTARNPAQAANLPPGDSLLTITVTEE